MASGSKGQGQAPNQNPFALGGKDGARGGPARKPVGHDWTPEEQTEKLKGYLEVPPDLWEHVRVGSHVRYISKTNGFRIGGFVAKNPFDAKPSNGDGVNEKRFMRLQTHFNEKAPSYLQWVLAYEDIEKLYMRPEAGQIIILQSLEAAVKGLNENIRAIVGHVKKLETRISALEGKK